MPRRQFKWIASLIGDTPFTVTPYFFLRRGQCDVYATEGDQPEAVVVVPHIIPPDVYVIALRQPLSRDATETVSEWLARCDGTGGFFVPGALIAPVRARHPIRLEAEGLCFIGHDVPAGDPERATRLGAVGAAGLSALPDQAAFLFRNYGTPAALIAEGLAFGIMHRGRLVSVAASLVRTPAYCDVGVYTLPRFRSHGYATDCVKALFASALAAGMQPLWRIGIRHKVAIRFAEKLGLREIGSDGQEVYLELAGTPRRSAA